MTLGSLFDGIGGFCYAATLSGIKPVWISEIDEWCIRVSEKNFTGVPNLGDIKGINGKTIKPVDIITFGSPCVDISFAGKKGG